MLRALRHRSRRPFRVRQANFFFVLRFFLTGWFSLFATQIFWLELNLFIFLAFERLISLQRGTMILGRVHQSSLGNF
jgi:hypothetical protein